MSHELKNKSCDLSASTWQPSATIAILHERAKILAAIRAFFWERGVLEVETPLLCHATVTDPYIESIPAQFNSGKKAARYFLQTSPEYAMKRLLAAGSGSIFQIGKAFRQGEIGRCHNPEFSMLEWYRLHFDHHALMDEMDSLLQAVLHTESADRKSYLELFQDFLNINPHEASCAELAECARNHHIHLQDEITDRNVGLDILLTHCIQPHIGSTRPFFLYDFPIFQAALARIRPGHPPVASRFEVYFKGIELANGFHELQNAEEQRQRFENNLLERKQLGLELPPIDENFLAALTHGLPDCAGVALGIDRLVMLALGKEDIKDILSFDFLRT